MSLNMNSIFQNYDLVLTEEKSRNYNGLKSTMNIISCRAKELKTHNKNNLYQVLSLEPQSVSQDELKKAYRAKARQLHPDVFPPSKKEECTERFVELREAYEVLSDPISRRMYDLSLLGDSVLYEEKEHFSRAVWEMQLDGLSKRSANRVKRRNARFV